MPLRLRKLIGAVLLILFLTVYALLVPVVAATVLPQAGKISELFFYLLAGLVWVPPAALLISWMHRGGEAPRA
jgi:hypothetical protein